MSPETSKWRHIITQHMLELGSEHSDLLFICKNCYRTEAGLILTVESCDIWDESDYGEASPSTILDPGTTTREFISWRKVGQLYCNRNARIAAQKSKRKGK